LKLQLLNIDFAVFVAAALRAAQTNIYICCYVMSGNQQRAADPISKILNILEAKKAAGVDVRVIIDNPKKNRPNFHANRVYLRQLYDKNIPFALNPHKTTAHMKAILCDNRSLFIGSHNLAHRSLFNPYELSIKVDDEKTAQEFKTLFLSMWENPEFYRYPPLTFDFDRIYP